MRERRIADARIERGWSQSQLGASVGLSFQQVQKYERGANRVSASVLFGIMQALRLSPTYFFEGLEGGENEATAAGSPDARLPADMRTFLMSKQDMRFMEAFLNAPGPAGRAVTGLVLNVTEAEDPSEGA